MPVSFKKYTLRFKKPAGTSRGTLESKDTYFLILQEGDRMAIGECNLFTKLSYDDRPDYESQLLKVCRELPGKREKILTELEDWPSIYFGVEMLLKDWENGGKRLIFPEVIKEKGFSVPVNGLIWMGERAAMLRQIQEKLALGFTSVKLKIGAIDFKSELELLKYIRTRVSATDVEIRLDANGAFSLKEAGEKLKYLSNFGISYVEQPIRAGRWQEMARLCEDSPVKIALDEDLIGIIHDQDKAALINTIHPPLLVLKPALIGGFSGADSWKKKIQEDGGNWIITSALESNIGLNAIAQYTALGWTEYAQGLGTGQLYTNNIPSPYTVDAYGLHYHPEKNWDLSAL